MNILFFRFLFRSLERLSMSRRKHECIPVRKAVVMWKQINAMPVITDRLQWTPAHCTALVFSVFTRMPLISTNRVTSYIWTETVGKCSREETNARWTQMVPCTETETCFCIASGCDTAIFVVLHAGLGNKLTGDAMLLQHMRHKKWCCALARL